MCLLVCLLLVSSHQDEHSTGTKTLFLFSVIFTLKKSVHSKDNCSTNEKSICLGDLEHWPATSLLSERLPFSQCGFLKGVWEQAQSPPSAGASESQQTTCGQPSVRPRSQGVVPKQPSPAGWGRLIKLLVWWDFTVFLQDFQKQFQSY